MVADAIRMPRILGAHPTPSESIWIRHVCPIPKLKSLSWFLILLKTHCCTLIILESRWVKIPCICSLRIYVVAMGEPRWIHNQDSPTPSEGGGSPQSLGPHSQRLSPGTVNQQQQQQQRRQQQQQCSLLRGLGLFSVGVSHNRVSELRC